MCVFISSTRAVAPVMLGSIYSFSLSPRNGRIGFPIDFHLAFITIGLVLLGSMIIAAFYPSSLNKSKQVPAIITDTVTDQTPSSGRMHSQKC